MVVVALFVVRGLQVVGGRGREGDADEGLALAAQMSDLYCRQRAGGRWCVRFGDEHDDVADTPNGGRYER